ncbi:MAG: fatty acid oxidation complex subunit alpha FadJ, partial [Gemmatimonadetes bacterium]|nr:fatty acid oxidation complex subunit alpha FadJ [Gemmatimonadota bacterium]
ERMAPAATRAVLAGPRRRGRTGARGFYLYEKGREKAFDPSVYSDMNLSSARTKPKPDHIRDRLVLVMINEAARVLEEGVVASAADVDLGMVMGTGFPPFRGGLLKYADDRGVAEVAVAMEALGRTCGDRYEPTALVAELARTGGSFHTAFPAGREAT